MRHVSRQSDRSGYTLIELVMSIAASSFLIMGMGSSIYLATRANDVSVGQFRDSNEGGHALAKLNRELKYAVALDDTASSTTAVEFTVSDITGDTIDDVIRYEWSGTSGDPVQRILNAGNPETIVDNVYDFFLVYNTKTVTSGGGITPPVFQEFTEAKLALAATAIEIAKPSGVAAGDLLIAAVAWNSGQTNSHLAPVDWNLVLTEAAQPNVEFAVWWKVAGGSEPSAYQFTWSKTELAYGWIMRLTGHDAANPIDAFSFDTPASSTSPACPAVNCTTDNTLILRLGAFDDPDITVDSPGLSGHTAITMDTTGTGSDDVSGGAGYVAQATAGDSGTSSFTLTADEEAVTVTIAIASDPGSSGSDKYYNKSVDIRLQVGASSGSIVHSGVRTINEPEVTAP